MKQTPPIDPDAAARPLFVLEERYPSSDGPWHQHRRAQLVHAAEGVLTITTSDGRWIAPPERAVWVPGGVRHSVASRRPFRLLTLYVEAPPAGLPRTCHVVAIDRLVAELLAAAARFGADYPPDGPASRLVQVILDRLPALAVTPMLHIPEPADAQLRKLTRALTNDPTDDRRLAVWAKRIGMTERTLARRFVAETGLTFGRWRQQLRLVAALDRLGAGASVTEVAFEVGYRDVSSFIAAFKAAMGVTPARYFDGSRRATS